MYVRFQLFRSFQQPARSLVSKMATDVKMIQLTARQHIKDIIPEMTFGMHKGQAGRIAVIGGCKEYTGAPYFAAFTAMRLGVDLSHVFCTEAAGTPIKTYSPDLIVHPILDASDAVDQVKYWLPRLHAVVIGPGLGRDEQIFQNVKGILNSIKEQKKPVVIDGDGLFLITQEPDLVANYKEAILTPNLIEFERLFQAVFNKKVDANRKTEELVSLSRSLGGVTLVGKGEIDIITDGEYVVKVTEKGSPRRCGGQGDILAGAVGTFIHWASTRKSIPAPAAVSGAFAACSLVKYLNKFTYDKFQVERPGDTGRSMVTGDMIENIATSLYLLTK
ncbi:ATP-dependent (S)-NAD(P)H-hydrate dehydratase-like [Rhopilema esculentum]|uniref:ATP-dependent (S)-NAD(P)H-hydrate dehydratase-like n=1 Tax=Rhopilema esculentum TaxID=499914 RepID=UPI0031D7A353